MSFVINVSVCKRGQFDLFFCTNVGKANDSELENNTGITPKSGCSQIRKHSSIYQHATDSAAGFWFKELKCNEESLSLPIKPYKNRLEMRKEMETSKICNIVSLQTQFDTSNHDWIKK